MLSLVQCTFSRSATSHRHVPAWIRPQREHSRANPYREAYEWADLKRAQMRERTRWRLQPLTQLPSLAGPNFLCITCWPYKSVPRDRALTVVTPEHA
jgi:hypothetical protein